MKNNFQNISICLTQMQRNKQILINAKFDRTNNRNQINQMQIDKITVRQIFYLKKMIEKIYWKISERLQLEYYSYIYIYITSNSNNKMLPFLQKQTMHICRKQIIELHSQMRWNPCQSKDSSYKNLYKFSNDKNKNHGQGGDGKQGSSNAKGKSPKIIEISKGQFKSMKKFLQDISLSMPMPNITPPEMSSSKRPDSRSVKAPGAPIDQNKVNSEEAKDGENVQDYFSSPQHILSFKLLKMSEPVQFNSILQQHKGSKDYSIKLLILHRFVRVGGIVSKNARNKLGPNVSKLAYGYVEEILKNMRHLQQHELQQFLQIYLTLHKQQEEEKELERAQPTVGNNQLNRQTTPPVQVPVLEVQQLEEEQLPLIQNPTHHNSRILVLLLQLWQLSTAKGLEEGKMRPPSPAVRRGMVHILNHYQLHQQTNREDENNKITDGEYSKQPLKYLAYVGICAYMCGLEKYNAIPMLMRSLRDPELMKQRRELIQCAQCVLQYCHLLDTCPASIVKEMAELRVVLAQVIEQLCLSADQAQDRSVSVDKEQQQLLGLNSQWGSGTIPTLLHSSLLSIQHNLSNISVEMGTTLSSTILKVIPTTPAQLSVQQYSQYWQSAMIMYKLLKISARSMQHHQLYTLVDLFINRIDVGSLVRDATTTADGEYVIQELVEKMETMLFDCLVAYRVILPPDLTQETLSKYEGSDKGKIGYANIRSQISGQQNQQMGKTNSQSQTRQVLRELLNGYRQICETMIKCGLVEGPRDSVIHNIIISCMIAEAYTTKQDNRITYALSPTIAHILNQYGVAHAKYGQYVGKLLEKYPMQELD